MKNIQNKLIRILDKCKICGRLWDEKGNYIKLPNFNYQINNEFLCKDCCPNFNINGGKLDEINNRGND